MPLPLSAIIDAAEWSRRHVIFATALFRRHYAIAIFRRHYFAAICARCAHAALLPAKRAVKRAPQRRDAMRGRRTISSLHQIMPSKICLVFPYQPYTSTPGVYAYWLRVIIDYRFLYLLSGRFWQLYDRDTEGCEGISPLCSLFSL